MTKPFMITKANGQKEPFDMKKFENSLKKSGAAASTIKKISNKIKQLKPETTKKLHQKAIQLLKKEHKGVAGRYNLKKALFALGPSGYPFEKYIAQLFKAQGYITKLNQLMVGKCVNHEVDIIIKHENRHDTVECKFHNKMGNKADVTIALSTRARFEDISAAWKKNPDDKHNTHRGWLVTNTQFTSETIKYGTCVGLQLLGWNYPHKNNLPQLIDQVGLHPITTLTTLTKKQKREFIKKGLVLCSQARKQKGLLKKFGFSDQKISNLILESESVCKLD